MARTVRKKVSERYCPRFGQIAVELEFITAEELKYALNIQIDEDIAGREHRLLGTVMFDNDWMSSEQIEAVLNLMLRQMRSEGEQEEMSP